MTRKQSMMVRDLVYAEKDLECPTFTWNGEDYPCIGSAPVQRLTALEDGGYGMVNTVSMTVRIFNLDGSYVFPDNVIPALKNNFKFLNIQFRIDAVNLNSIGASFEIVGNAPYQGI